LTARPAKASRVAHRPTEADPLARLEAALARHRVWIVMSILVLSVALRVAYFAELNAGPCIWQHRVPSTDMAFFDQWARAIVAGDWLTAYPLHPYQDWNESVAQAYFRHRPSDQASPPGAGSNPAADAAHRLWLRWWGGPRFHQEPLYPYLVAATYAVLGPDVRWVFAWQSVLGVLSNILVYAIARRYFGALAGLVAGLLATLCGPMLFFDLVLLRTTPTVFATLALVYLIGVVWERNSWTWWLAIGLACGAALLLQTTFLPFVLGTLMAVVGRFWRRWGGLASRAAALLAGLAVAVAPAIARNIAVGAGPLALSSVAAVVFACSNFRSYDPLGGFVTLPEPLAQIMAAGQGAFLPAVVATLRTHPSIGSYLTLLADKLGALWSWYELPNNASLYYYRLHAPTLYLTCITFPFVAALGAVGALAALPKYRTRWPLLLMLVTSLAPLLVFYSLARFRTPSLALLMPLAAFTLTLAVRWLWQRRVARLIGLALPVALLLVAALRPLPPDLPPIQAFDYRAPYPAYYAPLERRAREAGDWARAATIMRDSLRYEPVRVREFGPSRPPRDDDERLLVETFGVAHLRLAEDLIRAGQPAAAAPHQRRAQELSAALRPPPQAAPH
jgi:4-amino-4-deoxy-L-arabinose transferase-like glycosyltransferase